MVDMIAAGYSLDEISAELVERALDPALMLRASFDLLERRAYTADIRLAAHLEMRRQIFRDARAAGDLAVALSAAKDMARLEGLYSRPASEDDDADPLSVIPVADELDAPVM